MGTVLLDTLYCMYIECILGSSPFAGRTKPAIGGDRSGSGRMSVMPAVVLSPPRIFSRYCVDCRLWILGCCDVNIVITLFVAAQVTETRGHGVTLLGTPPPSYNQQPVHWL